MEFIGKSFEGTLLNVEDACLVPALNVPQTRLSDNRDARCRASPEEFYIVRNSHPFNCKVEEDKKLWVESLSS